MKTMQCKVKKFDKALKRKQQQNLNLHSWTYGEHSEKNRMIFEWVVSFKILISAGRENPMDMSAIPSQGEEKTCELKKQREMPPAPEAVTPLVSSTRGKS